MRFRKINRTPRIRSDLAVSGVSRSFTNSSVIAGVTAPLLRVLSAILLCLILTGSADAGASSGPVVGWGDDRSRQATPRATYTGHAAPGPSAVTVSTLFSGIQPIFRRDRMSVVGVYCSGISIGRPASKAGGGAVGD